MFNNFSYFYHLISIDERKTLKKIWFELSNLWKKSDAPLKKMLSQRLKRKNENYKGIIEKN